MHRAGINNLGANARFFKVGPQRVPLPMKQRKLMPDTLSVRRDNGQLNVCSLDSGTIFRRDLAASRGPSSEFFQFDVEHRALKPVHPEIETHLGMGVP